MTAGDLEISTPSAVIDRRYSGCFEFSEARFSPRCIPDGMKSRKPGMANNVPTPRPGCDK